jgi:hypothetical protein
MTGKKPDIKRAALERAVLDAQEGRIFLGVPRLEMY